MRSTRGQCLLFALGLVLLAAPGPSAAQDPGAPVDTLTADPTPDQITGFLVVPLRDRGSIEKERDTAKQAKSELEDQSISLKSAEASAKARVQIKKAKIEVTEARIDAAKKEKDEAGKLRYEAEKKRLEVEKKFLEQLANLHGLALQRAERARDLADARKNALEMELLFGERYDKYRLTPAGDPSAVAKEKEMRDAERKVLEAMGKAADAERELASKEKELAEKKASLFDVIKEYRQLP